MTPQEASQFDAAMFSIYKRAKQELNYNATIFLDMLYKHKGYETAVRLIRAAMPSDGYTALWEKDRLDLTVEALVIQEPWRSIFDPADIERAVKRLKDYQFKFGEPQ
jgi:hypothetical protein